MSESSDRNCSHRNISRSVCPDALSEVGVLFRLVL